VLYVEALIGRDTVNTMPTATVQAYRESGQPRPDTILEDLEAARRTLMELRELGIDIDQVTQQLLAEGVRKFNESSDALLADLTQKAQRIAAG
jgi:transaldolase